MQNLQRALLAFPGVARAASGHRVPSSHELDRSNSAIRCGFTSGARWRRASAAWIAFWRPASQSITA
jgi:hypothetical protein